MVGPRENHPLHHRLFALRMELSERARLIFYSIENVYSCDTDAFVRMFRNLVLNKKICFCLTG